jgi:hypothetical protein
MMAGTGRDTAQAGAVSNWMVQMLAVLAIVGLVVFETVALAVTAVSVDDAAREVARAARDQYRAEQSLDRTAAVADEVAEVHGATVTSLETNGDELIVTLEKRANTLLAHRIGPLAERVTPSATRRVALRP